MTEASQVEGTLQTRYPLPEWVVDSKYKQELTLAVAGAVGAAVESWPTFEGPGALKDYAEHVTREVRDRLEPWLNWMDDFNTDGFSYPGDPLVSYISQLSLTRPGESPDTGHYRDLLRFYGRYLLQQARRFD